MNLLAKFMISLVLILIVKMNHIFCIHSSIECHLGCFQFLAMMNKASMNRAECLYPGEIHLVFGVELLPIDFKSVCTSLKFHQQWAVYPLVYILVFTCYQFRFFILATLTGITWNVRDIFICIFMTIKDVGYFFKCF